MNLKKASSVIFCILLGISSAHAAYQCVLTVQYRGVSGNEYTNEFDGWGRNSTDAEIAAYEKCKKAFPIEPRICDFRGKIKCSKERTCNLF